MHGFIKRRLAEVQLYLAGQGLVEVQLVAEMRIDGLFLWNKRHCLGNLDLLRELKRLIGAKVICKRKWEGIAVG